MNEQLEQAVVALINKAVETADTASDFIVGEAPVVVEQLLLWHSIESLIFFSFSITLAVMGYFLGVHIKNTRIRKWDAIYLGKESSANEERCPIVYSLSPYLYALIPFIIAAMNNEWLKILIAPKVWLIEYAAKIAG